MAKDFRNQTDLYIGLRNNNPGNIRPSASQWQGAVGEKGGFVTFSNLDFGIRALAINANTHISRGNNTIRRLITLWAPPTDGNHTEAYIDAVAKQTSHPENAVMPTDRDFWFKLIRAIVNVENGKQAFLVTAADIDAGLNLAADRINIKKKVNPSTPI